MVLYISRLCRNAHAFIIEEHRQGTSLWRSWKKETEVIKGRIKRNRIMKWMNISVCVLNAELLRSCQLYFWKEPESFVSGKTNKTITPLYQCSLCLSKNTHEIIRAEWKLTRIARVRDLLYSICDEKDILPEWIECIQHRTMGY